MRLPVTLALALTASACAPASTAPNLGTALDRLVACGLATPGDLHGSLFGLYVPDDCYAHCYASASCEELAATICGTDVAMRVRCDAECAFACGDQSLVGREHLCDGVNDCMDGSDEAGCEHFVCDGNTLPAAARCNGYAQCSDGRDEADCPGQYCQVRSDWGDYRVFLYPYSHCNGYVECADGSDEAGCETLRCDGYAITYDPAHSLRCDGYAQCSDNSDEAGCPASATLVQRCGGP